MALSTALGWGNLANLVLAVALAFLFGYALTLTPVLGAGVSFGQATKITLASETVSISIMEAVDNGFVTVIPGALDAGLGDAKFWWSIALGFAIAYAPTWWANRALIARGKGHAVAHRYHDH
jgi:hypothetical protein